jgi:hypothetical protein
MLMLGFPVAFVALALSAGDVPGLTEQQARVFFEDYVAKSRSSDPREADLYCDEGEVEHFREDASGNVARISGSASIFKQVIRESAAQAHVAGDYSDFSGATYQSEAGGIRITAVRYSALGKYASPATFLVGDCERGGIGILEMTFHSRALQE